MANRKYAITTRRKEIEEMWNEGFSLGQIADSYDVKYETLAQQFDKWGIDYKDREDAKPIVIAKKKFKREYVMVDGKPMLDITSLVVDCGG